MHASMKLHLEAAWKQAPPIVAFAADAKSSSRLLSITADKWGKRWVSRFDEMSADIAASFAERSSRATQVSMLATLKAAGFTVRFKPTKAIEDAYRAVISSNISLIKSIPAQYLKDVQTSVWNAVMNGSDLETLSRDLVKNYGVSYRKAAFIARDQNAKAKATIEQTRRAGLGLTKGIWMHSGADKDPRKTHLAANGKVFDLAKGIYDKDVGKWVQAGELPGCTCTSRALVPGYND